MRLAGFGPLRAAISPKCVCVCVCLSTLSHFFCTVDDEKLGGDLGMRLVTAGIVWFIHSCLFKGPGNKASSSNCWYCVVHPFIYPYRYIQTRPMHCQEMWSQDICMNF